MLASLVSSLVWALMVVEGRKCLRASPVVLLPPARSQQLGAFLAEHHWSLTALTERLVPLVVTTLGDRLQVHGAYLLGKATTMVAKTTKRMLGVQKRH